MKALLRTSLIHLTALYTASVLIQGFKLNNDLYTLISATIVFILLNKLVKPLIKLLLLPINIITLGLFSWAINVITLFILQIIISGVSVIPFYFTGLNIYGFTAPAMQVSIFFSYILSSVTIWTIINLIKWLFV